jgi:hydrogenase maturation protein HypF
MASCLEEARGYCELSSAEAELLQGVVRPIVLLHQKHSNLAEGLTPRVDEIGVMLPYTPLHQLLFQEEGCPQTLVMTSGNRSGAPLYIANDAALQGLTGIADCFLLHNREILTRVDDSVVRLRKPHGKIQILRRARGFVPAATPLIWELPTLLACGGGLKSTFCLTRGREAFLSQHIGDLFNLESLDFFEESIYHLKRLLQVTPQAVVCDLHPDYLSSRYARDLGLPLYTVQHHHAHAVAVMAEHGIREKVLALVLDGTGLGDDGTIWGGELLEADCQGYTRLGSLSTMQLPGGDKAAMEPWRMGLALLHALGQESPCMQIVEDGKQAAVWQMLQQGFNCPETTSCGRFFDGIAALLGVCLVSDYEGQAAIELEALARSAMGDRELDILLAGCLYNEESVVNNGRLVLQQQALTRRVLEQLDGGQEKAVIALDFHLCLIKALAGFVLRISQQVGLKRVVLAGGCMQNSLVLRGLFIVLEQAGCRVYTGEEIPVNDGGIALGQAVIGGLVHVSSSSHESC